MALADDRSSPNVLWLLSDHQGTVRDITNNAGALQNHLRYDSFGRITSQTNSSINTRFDYTGREFDLETGLYYYRSRYYDPAVGRFIGEDRIGFAGRDANLYRYVGNSPTNATDPFGLQVLSPSVPVLPMAPPNLFTPSDPSKFVFDQLLKQFNDPTLRKINEFLKKLKSPIKSLPKGNSIQKPTPSPSKDPKKSPPDPNGCSPANDFKIPLREKDKWPRRCQLDSQGSQPYLNREVCSYRCKDDGGRWVIPAYVPLGSKCPQWIDWIPGDRMLDPNNLPPDAIP